jgi:hypothetical protein
MVVVPRDSVHPEESANAATVLFLLDPGARLRRRCGQPSVIGHCDTCGCAIVQHELGHLTASGVWLNDALGDGFGAFLQDACTNLVTVTKGAVYIAMSSSELHTLQAAFTAAGGKWSTFIIWTKNTFTLGRADYQRQYEPILYGWPRARSTTGAGPGIRATSGTSTSP